MEGKNQSRTLSDARLKAMRPGQELTDSLPGRGAGSLLFKRPGEGPPVAYYRYRHGGATKLLRIGIYRSKASVPGMTLEMLRARGRELAQILAEHGDPRLHLEQLEQTADHKRLEAERVAAVEASRGSFEDLFRDYVESRRGKVRPDQIDEFERILRVDLLEAAPEILCMKARDVGPQHVRRLLQPIWDRGAPRQAAKVRSFLRAAFQHGLSAEHSLERASQLTFALTVNPVDAIPVPGGAKAGRRALSNAELRQFWQTIVATDGVGFVMSRLFRFVVATAGQRIEQVAREPWSSYDFKGKTLTVTDAKGRAAKGSETVKRKHLVPLSDRAIAILEEVRQVTGDQPWPWASNGKQPFVTTSFAHAAADWCRSPHAKIDGRLIERFTPRDLRRTCSQLMQRAGIDDLLSDLLQSHGLTGVVASHYRNNPEAYLPRKLDGMSKFEAALAGVLDVIEQRGVTARWVLSDGQYRAEVEGAFCFTSATLDGLQTGMAEMIELVGA